jgi:outer membrane protein OmpA-like peptidoglycan-associated protein
VGAGGAITGTWMARPAFEGTVGWGIGVGDVVIVPSVGVTHLFSWDDPLGGVGAVMGRASLGIVLGDTPPPAPPEPEVPADVDFPDPPPVVDPCTQPDVDGSHAAAGCPVPPPVVLADRDHDGFLDDEDACPDQEETLNGVEDDDGCPDQGLVELHGDRVVLDDRVLFEFDRARVVRSARPILEAVVTMFQGHSQWDRVRVEGHADERGDDELNLALSERRARAVREQLVEMGVPEDRIDIAAYGESRLLDTETTEEAHARNRRVELVMIDDGGALPPARPEEQTR